MYTLVNYFYCSIAAEATQSASAVPKNIIVIIPTLFAGKVSGLTPPTKFQSAGKAKVRLTVSGTNLSVRNLPAALLLVVSVKLPVNVIVGKVPLRVDMSRSTLAAYVSALCDTVVGAVPVDPIGPVDPAGPLGPLGPSKPRGPAGPLGPATVLADPINPADPTNPITPCVPVEPV
jgi:hypothetical protein